MATWDVFGRTTVSYGFGRFTPVAVTGKRCMAMTDTELLGGTTQLCPTGPQPSATGLLTLFTKTVNLPEMSHGSSEATRLENAAHAWAQLADEALLRGDQDAAIDMIAYAYQAADSRMTRA